MSFQTLENVLQVLTAGLMIGSVYGLMCLGLGLIFSVMRIINFAQGEFLMLGMYGMLYALAGFGAGALGGWSPFLAAFAVSPLLFLFGALSYRFTLSDINDRRGLSEESKHSAQLVITLGLALIVQNAGLIFFGNQPQVAKTPLSASAWTIGPMFGADVMVFLNKARLAASLLALALAFAVFFFVSRTRFGKSVRAAADDADAASYSGIDIRTVYLVTFGLGAAVTGLAGSLMGTFYPFHPFVGLEFVIIMYSGVVLGGMGSILGAFWGGLTIGLVQQLSTLVMPQQLQNAAIFVVFLLILLVRPEGLFGRSAERT